MSRRANNEGTIRKRPDGRWEARITLPDGRRKSIYAKTRAEVGRKLSLLQAGVEKGRPTPDDRVTVGQFLVQWLRDSVKPSVRPRTYDSYASHVRLHLEPALGGIPLTKLSPQHVQRFMNGKLDDGLSPATVLRIRATLRRALNQALKWGMIERNVATLIDPPQAPRPRFEPLTPTQAQVLLEAVKDDRLEALYVLALATGLRQGELLDLRWQDVDLGACSVTVRHSMQRVNGKLQLVKPKTELSQRRLPIPAQVSDQLREHRERQVRERRLLGPEWDEHDLVFCTRFGRPLDGSNVTIYFQKILEQAGLPKMRFHDLRHSCATFLLTQGVDLQVVKETLGHSQIALTADTYAHVMPSLKEDAARRMGELLWGDGGDET